MFSRLRARLTYANVVSTLCLFLVLGGGSAYAAATIGASDIKDDAVRPRHIDERAVRTGHIDFHSIRSVEVKNHSLKGRDVENDSLTGHDVDESSLDFGLERVHKSSSYNSQSSKSVTPECPEGKKVLGAGATIVEQTTGAPPNEEADVVVTEAPSSDLSRVFVTAIEEEPTAEDWQVRGYAVCAKVS